MARPLAYTQDGSYRFESAIIPRLTVMTPAGHARFIDGAFQTSDPELAETLIRRFPELPGLSLTARPGAHQPAPNTQPARPWRRVLRG